MADGAIRDILERSIDELPDELRTVFVACVVDGMTPEQFAELSALTSETVNARLHMRTICWLKCLYASSVPRSVASMSFTIAVPSTLRTQ
jgi:Sigma-70, region 4